MGISLEEEAFWAREKANREKFAAIQNGANVALVPDGTMYDVIGREHDLIVLASPLAASHAFYEVILLLVPKDAEFAYIRRVGHLDSDADDLHVVEG